MLLPPSMPSWREAIRVDAFSFHPGFVATGFGTDSPLLKFGRFVSGGSMGISAEQGATPLVHLATVDTVDAANGTYFDGVRIDTALLSDGAEVQVGKFRLTFYASRVDLAHLASK